MAGLSGLADLLAALMLLTSAYCLSRLTLSWRRHRPTDRKVDGTHLLMGVAMAGMLVPALRVLPAGGWEVIFGAGAVLFCWRVISDARAEARFARGSGHHLQHVLACAAMVYMLAAATTAKAASGGAAAAGMAGGAAHFRTLALVLALGLFGYVVWTVDRFSSLAPVAASVTRPTSAAATSACHGGDSTARPVSAPGSPAGDRIHAPLSPRLAACCEIAMGVTMGYMLIMML